MNNLDITRICTQTPNHSYKRPFYLILNSLHFSNIEIEYHKKIIYIYNQSWL